MFQKLLSIRRFRASDVLRARKDYYSTPHTGILGISRSASEPEIKKAYFSLAKQYHPDVNKAADAKHRFSEIAEYRLFRAYDTLSNSEKRKMYDATGMTGDEQEQARNSGADFSGGFNPFGGFGPGFGGGQSNFNGFGSFQDILNEFEQMFMGGGQSEKKSFQGEDIHLSVTIPFLDAVKGGQVPVSLERRTVCGTCNGTKVKPGTSPTKCTNCGGRGVVYFQRGPVSVQTPCQKCRGTGSTIRHHCPTCKGMGITSAQITEIINIPAGVDSGKTLRVLGKGHHAEVKGGRPGHLIVKVTVQSHPIFRREGFDLFTTVEIPLSQAALGGTVQVETLEGKISLKVEAGDDFGVPKRLSGKGVPHLPPDNHRRGDLYATLQVKIPKSLTTKQRLLFEELAKEESEQVPEGFFSKFYKKSK